MKNNIIKIVILSSFILCAIILMGCSNNNSNNVLSSTINNMCKINNTLDKVQDIDNNSLIIDDIMNKTNLANIDPKYYYVSDSSTTLNSFVTKLAILNNDVVNTINLNNVTNSTKTKLYSKTEQIKALCEKRLKQKQALTDNEIKVINDVNSEIASNNTKISLTRNEISNYYKNVITSKPDYYKNVEKISSKYVKLQNGLNNRLSYYTNIINSLNTIENLLSEIEWTTYPTLKSNDAETEECLAKNIDTYENYGTNIYGDLRNNPIYNKDNYLRNLNPGYGMEYYNPYGIGGYGYGFGGMYNYGMPFGNRYIYPNINSFGSYKNIDGYKSRKELDKLKESQLINDNNYQEDSINDGFNKKRPEPIPRPYPKPNLNKENKMDNYKQNNIEVEKQFEDNNEDKFVNKDESIFKEITNDIQTLEELNEELTIIKNAN